MESLESVKNAKLFLLKRSVNGYLKKNYDWKVARSVSTGEPLSPIDTSFRQSIVNEYNYRAEKLRNAETVEEALAIPVGFNA